MKEKKKEEFVDDGRVIADMDCENITGYKSKRQRKAHEELRELQITRKERWAIYKATFQQFMPPFLLFVGSLLAIILFLYFFWLN